MRLFLLLTLTCFCFAAEEAVKLPPDVLAAEEKNEKAAKDIKAKADADLAKANDALLKIYLKAVEAATKKGDLKLALALQGKAEKLDEATDLLSPPKAKEEKKAEADGIKARVVGRWNSGHGYIWELREDGTCLSNNKYPGMWNIISEGKVVEMKWNTGNTDTFDVPAEKAQTTTGKSASGRILNVARAP